MERLSAYHISPLTKEDVEAAERMSAQSWIDTYPSDEHGVSEEAIRQHVEGRLDEESLDRRRETAEVADETKLLQQIAKDEQGNIVGIIVAHKDRNKQQVKALYVDKAHHGSGVAGELLSTSLDWFSPDLAVQLEVASYNERAIKFYEKHGFSIVEGTQHFISDIIPAINMIRGGSNEV